MPDDRDLAAELDRACDDLSRSRDGFWHVTTMRDAARELRRLRARVAELDRAVGDLYARLDCREARIGPDAGPGGAGDASSGRDD